MRQFRTLGPRCKNYQVIPLIFNMLSFRRETDYAIHLLRALSIKDAVVSLKNLAEQTHVSFLFFQKIARKLRQAGLIEAEQGVNGGYRLLVSPRQLSLRQVLKVTEGDCCFLPCLGKKGFTCAGIKKCRLKSKVGKINNDFIKMLEKVKLSDL